MGTGPPGQVTWPSRLLAVIFYLGLAPPLAVLRLHQRNPYLRHHYAQAVALAGVLAYLLLGGLAGFVAGAYLIVYHEDVWKAWSLDSIGDVVFGVLFLIWALAWLAAVVLALAGSVRSVPLIRRVSRGRRRFRAALVGNVGLLLVVAAVSAMTLHALAITREDARPAQVYMLYDSGDAPVPRWVFVLGFYRVALAAQARFGPDSVVVAPLTEENLRQAMRHGRFVFLGSHGSDGYVTTPDLLIVPDKRGTACQLWAIPRTSTSEPFSWKDARPVESGGDLQFVYNCACDGGAKGDLWQEALAPAEVRTFPRTSAVGEHILWLWLDGPGRVEELR